MSKFIEKYIIKPFKNMKYYFTVGEESIKQYNISSMRSLSLLGFFGVSFLMIITPLLIHTWRPSIGHFIIIIAFAFYWLLGTLIKEKKYSYKIIEYIVISYIIVFMSLVMYINIVPYNDTSVSLIMATMIIFPLLFIIPFYINIGILIFDFVCSIYLLSMFSADKIGNDIFNLIAGFLFGIVGAWIVTNLRAKDNRSRVQLVHYSNHDDLTGLLNKAAFERECMTYMEIRETPCTFVIFDIDNFKVINDQYGHLIGDQVLSIIGVQVKKHFRDSDLVGRFGGDEFILLLNNLSSKELLREKIETFNKDLQEIIMEELHIKMTCSFGGLILGTDYIGYSELFKRADNLLYRSKKFGKNNSMLMTVQEYDDLLSNKNKMLIVDDEEVNIAILKEIFNDDYEIVSALGGKEAINLIDKEMFNVILLDILMPEVNGYEVLNKIKKDPKFANVPVVVISADEQSELQMLELGVADMIIKPFNNEVTKQRVNNAVKHWGH